MNTKKNKTTLKKLAKLKDSEIDYSDIPDLSKHKLAWEKGRVAYPIKEEKMGIYIRLEKDLINWFKKQVPSGKNYQALMREVLNSYKSTFHRRR